MKKERRTGSKDWKAVAGEENVPSCWWSPTSVQGLRTEQCEQQLSLLEALLWEYGGRGEGWEG